MTEKTWRTLQKVGVVVIFGPLVAMVVIWTWQNYFVTHDEIRFTTPAIVSPTTVNPGDTLTIRYDEYCNEGVDFTTQRKADVIVDGRIVASYDIGSITFFSAENGSQCFQDIDQKVRLPNFLLPGVYRLENVATWSPNGWVSERTFTGVTQEFTVR